MKYTRILAPASLILASLLFLATLPYASGFVGGLLHAFAEASMVGGLADWFAVVALFRHPFGIPIPHTGILPRHRAKLTAGIIDMVQNSWLSKSAIQDRIRRWHILEKLLHAAEDPVMRASLRRMARTAHAEATRSLPADLAAGFAAGLIRDRVTAEEMMTAVKGLAEFAVAQDLHHAVLTRVLPGMSGWLRTDHVRDLVADNLRKASENYAVSPIRKLGKWMAERSSMLDYRELAYSVLRTAREEIEDLLQDPAHPLRSKFDAAIRTAVAALPHDESFRRMLEDMRGTACSSPAFIDTIARLIEQVNNRLGEDLAREDSAIMRFVFELLDHQIERIRRDAVLSSSAEQWLQDRIIAILDANHDEIGLLVRHNLEKLNDDQLVAQIEAKVGSDLQFIRVNGAVVGGLVGAVLYLAKYLTL
jgi:uncharacterized membrane-anchored protein YjiN (DUF445 family)